jgi:hypothetical protein
VRQNEGAAHKLISFTRIRRRANRQLNRLVKFRRTRSPFNFLTASSRFYLRPFLDLLDSGADISFRAFSLITSEGASEILDFIFIESEIWNLKFPNLSPLSAIALKSQSQIKNQEITQPSVPSDAPYLQWCAWRSQACRVQIGQLRLSQSLQSSRAKSCRPFPSSDSQRPFDMPAAFFSKSAAGGVLVSNVKERSA